MLPEEVEVVHLPWQVAPGTHTHRNERLVRCRKHDHVVSDEQPAARLGEACRSTALLHHVAVCTPVSAYGGSSKNLKDLKDDGIPWAFSRLV